MSGHVPSLQSVIFQTYSSNGQAPYPRMFFGVSTIQTLQNWEVPDVPLETLKSLMGKWHLRLLEYRHSMYFLSRFSALYSP